MSEVTIPGLPLTDALAVDTLFEICSTPGSTPTSQRMPGQKILDFISSIGLASLTIGGGNIKLMNNGTAVFGNGETYINNDGSVTIAGGDFTIATDGATNINQNLSSLSYSIGTTVSIDGDGSCEFGLFMIGSDGSFSAAILGQGFSVDSNGNVTFGQFVKLANLVNMTQNQTNTVDFNIFGGNETQYDDQSTTIASLTINLPTTTTPGQTLRYVTKATVTSVTVTGTVTIGTAITTLAANASVAWQAVDTNGTFIRIQ